MLTTDCPDQQPVIVIAGIAVSETHLTALTGDWLQLKRRFYPDVSSKLNGGWLDAILHDIKGTTLRRGFKIGAKSKQRQHAHGLISGAISILEQYDAKLLGRIWVKECDDDIDDLTIHSSSLQYICEAFNSRLHNDERGMVVVDSQTYWHNHRLAHSMFTRRFGKRPKNTGLADMPVFGHSDNHAGLQIADLMCSAVLAPIASIVYAGSYSSWNTHCNSGFLDIREEFGERLAARTFGWRNQFKASHSRRSRSLVVSDPIGKRSTRLMWGPATDERTRADGRVGSVSSTAPLRQRWDRTPGSRG